MRPSRHPGCSRCHRPSVVQYLISDSMSASPVRLRFGLQLRLRTTATPDAAVRACERRQRDSKEMGQDVDQEPEDCRRPRTLPSLLRELEGIRHADSDLGKIADVSRCQDQSVDVGRRAQQGIRCRQRSPRRASLSGTARMTSPMPRLPCRGGSRAESHGALLRRSDPSGRRAP